MTIDEILDSSTVKTYLPVYPKKKDGPRFRVRVGEPSLIPYKPVKLNFYADLLPRPILAKNGVIYLLGNAPLLPPLSPLAQAFLFPGALSTLTSGVAKAMLAPALLPKVNDKVIPWDHAGNDEDEVDERVMHILGDIVDEGKKKLHKQSFTIFAPTNRAFSQLGIGINAFLFSPFGERVLRFILKYHVVPDLVFHTDHIDNTTSLTDSVVLDPMFAAKTDIDVPWPADYDWVEESSLGWTPKVPGPTPPGQVNVTRYELPTLLGSAKNETIHVDVAQYRLRFGKGPLARRVVVKPSPYGPKRSPSGKEFKPIAAIAADAVAWGGAIHVLPSLVPPPFPKAHEHGHSPRELERLHEIIQMLQ